MVRAIRIIIAISLFACSALADERGAAQRLEDVRESPLLLRRFLEAMPKGGDLHNHLAGAVYAESYLRWAAEDGLCIDKVKLAIVAPPCEEANDLVPAKNILDTPLYSQLIDSLSMRNYKPATENGHDRFFATFSRYRPASRGRSADMLVDVVGREARDNVDYLEITTGLDSGAARQIPLPENASFEEMYAALTAAGSKVPAIVAQGRKAIDDAQDGMKRKLQCGRPDALPGCQSTVRFIAEIHRGYPRTQIFAEMVVGFEIASVDPRVVAINPVMPEDGWRSMNDFDEQMRMLKFLRAKYPKAHLTTHAGELAPGLVPPEGLRNHVRDSVLIAGAQRIGHGVDVARETDAIELLQTMASRGVAVEICLTSNDVILGITGKQHPLSLYLHHDVPVVFATDDPGVSRGDLTTEFQRAVEEHGLGYEDLKRAARNSIEFSFIEGASLWKDATYTSKARSCEASPKTREQCRLEQRLSEFEKAF